MPSSRCPFPPSLVYRLFAAVLLLISTTAIVRGANDYPELPRFRQIDAQLYRGAQPRRGGLSRLTELGINTVVNLRGADALTRTDEAEARALGLNYFNIPLPVWGRPDDASVKRVMQIVSAPESGRVFIHCKDGVDRTGMIVALYRMTREDWSPDVAIDEAMRSGMRRNQYWMRDYINDYYARLQRKPGDEAKPGDERHDDIKDRIGAGVRVSERAVFRVKSTAVQMARKTPSAVKGFLGRVF
jgi:protein tyrosine phosphatase (PTP) superfamily phosphohydrolase (DUF442 family)